MEILCTFFGEKITTESSKEKIIEAFKWLSKHCEETEKEKWELLKDMKL